MELAVSDAAAALGVNSARVRAMLKAGRLHGRRVGNQWLIDGDEISRAARERAPGGRPLSPARAWGVLDLLDGGNAPWLDAVGRHRARVLIDGLFGASANRWRAALARRQNKIPCHVHPAALPRIHSAPGVVEAGPMAAAKAGADLVAVDPLPEVYIDAAVWPDLERRLAIRPDASRPNLIVRVPVDVWPFADERLLRPGLAMLAADLLDSAEPRAINAGVEALNRLAGQFPSPRRQQA